METGLASNAVLITGCSTGIGRAAALRFAKEGMPVWASARNLDSIADLEEAGCHLVQLDVTDEQSRTAALAKIEERHGAVGALVNNAGYAEMGPLEEISLESLRKQFETNVIGLVRLTQLVLPGMRQQGHGTIVNLSSVGGLLTMMGGGPYHMTKYAVESFSDALRAEVRRFGIRVAVVEPLAVRTNFANTGTANIPDLDGPYATFKKNLFKLINSTENNARVPGPEKTVEMIYHAVTSARPKTRYRNFLTRTAARTRRLLSDRMWDRLTARIIPME